MKHNLKLAEPYSPAIGYSGPYHEIALHVRELLECDYALVATADLYSPSLPVRFAASS